MNRKIQNLPRTIFFGTPGFAVPALEKLATAGYPVVAAVTQPDKQAGRSRSIAPSPVKVVAELHHIPAFQPQTLRDSEFFKTYTSLRPELCVVAAYGKIIPQSYIELPKFGIVNIHPSLLPEYRGPSPIQAAIANGDAETGVSIMLIDAEMDHGPILASQNFSLDLNATFPQIESQLAELGARMLLTVLPEWTSGHLKPTEQDHSQATFSKILARQDGLIDWSQPASRLHNQIRAYNPEPGTWTKFSGKVLNILKSCLLTEPSSSVKPGQVLKENGHIIVGTGQGFLSLEEVQLEGSKPMTAQSFVNGHQNFIGSTLGEGLISDN